MGNNNSASKKTTPSETSLQSLPKCESLELFNTLQCLPDGINSLKSVKRLSKKTLRERKEIIKKLRNMADQLAKTHSNVLIADRVGTGVGIGSGLLFIGGLVAAPFTAGISLGLTIAGTTTGLMGAITSVGANITGLVITKNSLAPLEKELNEHLKNLKELSSVDPQYLDRATRFRPTLEILAKLSETEWTLFLQTIKKNISHILHGNNDQVRQSLNQVVDPHIKNLLNQLPLPLDSNSLRALAVICTDILSHIRSIKQAILAFLNFLKKPELSRIAMVYVSNSTAKSITTTTQEVAQIKSAFKGTPMAMTKTVRAVASAATAVFIVIDVIHMVHICQETGETPTVQNLRKMANDLEKECQFIDETEESAEIDESDGKKDK